MVPTTLSCNESAPAVLPRVLVVDDEPELVELIVEAVGQSVACKLTRAKTLGEARHLLETAPVDLLVTDVHLPDGDGTALLPLLRQRHPHAAAIVITGTPTVEGAITALRNGAVDFLCKPFAGADLAERVRKALKRQGAAAKNERRLVKLRDAVRRLNDARKVVTKKVDLLCNDLISAYGELSRQLDLVRTQEGFKHFLADVKDLEQLLCHTMDYLMRQMGYCNIAIWLAGDAAQDAAGHEGGAEGADANYGPNEITGDADFQLGAYMKYTIIGEKDLTEALRRGLVRKVSREGLLHLAGDEAQEKLTPAELDYLADQDLLAINCTYLGEALAVVVLFRDGKQEFIDADVACLQAVAPLFAVALANAVRGQSPDADADADSGGEAADEAGEDRSAEGREGRGQGGLMDDPAHEPPADQRRKGKRRRGNPKKKEQGDPTRNDDWWKKGEPPPF